MPRVAGPAVGAPPLRAVRRAATASGVGPGCVWRPGARARSRERIRPVGSPQTLSQADRRVVAAWAADCAERVLGLFEANAPGDSRPRDAIARTRAFARGELGVAGEIRRRFGAGGAAREVCDAAAVAAARAAGQAASIAHMGAHALGAAAYAAKAAGLAAPHRPEAVDEEIRWQFEQMSPATESRPAAAAARRREFLRSARTGTPRVGPSRQDHPPAPGQSDGAPRGPSVADERRRVCSRFV